MAKPNYVERYMAGLVEQYDHELKAILRTAQGRQALKALLAQDGPVLEAKATLLRLTYHGPHPDDVKAALAAAVDALDSSEEDA